MSLSQPPLLASSVLLAESRYTLKTADYRIGWISTLPLEFFAARALLDEEYQHNDLAFSFGDCNDYILGRVGKHKVVLNCPSGGYGQLKASKIADDMKRSFPWIRFTLLVGIGGGLPLKHDIRLGDVVTATTVIPYDVGQATESGFKVTGEHVSPPDVLLQTVTELEYRLQSKNMSQMIEQTVNDTWSCRSVYARPTKDRLYYTDFLHQQECDRCDCLCEDSQYPSKVRPRQPREGSLVWTHRGPIGSANRVMKNARERDDLWKQHNIICLEMEANGVMSNIGCLPIRGISDYADGHKHDEWQRYAALAASVYAKELLHVIRDAKVREFKLEIPGNMLEEIVQAALRSVDAVPPTENSWKFVKRIVDNSPQSAKRALVKLLEAHDLTEELLRPQLEKLKDPSCAKSKAIRQKVEDLSFWQVQAGKSLKRLGEKIDLQSKATVNNVTKAEWDKLKAQVDENTSRIEALSTATQSKLQTTTNPTLHVKRMAMYEKGPMYSDELIYKTENTMFRKVFRYPQQFTRRLVTTHNQFMQAIALNGWSRLDARQSPPASDPEITTHPSSASTTNRTHGSQLRRKLSNLRTGLLSGLCCL